MAGQPPALPPLSSRSSKAGPSSSIDSPPVSRTSAYGLRTNDEQEQTVHDAIQPIVDNGMKVIGVNIRSISYQGFSSITFASLLRVLTTHDEPGVMGLIFAEALRAGVMVGVRQMNLTELISVCRWLRSPDGQKAVQNVYRMNKLEKKAGGVALVDKVAWTQVLTQQISDMSSSINELRSNAEEELARLQLRMDAIEKDLYNSIASVRAAHFPASEYREPAAEDITSKAFARYAAEVGDTAIEILGYECAQRIAVDKFGADLRRQAMVEFVNQDINKAALNIYLREKILSLEGGGDYREARNFRNLLAAAGGEVPPAPTFGAEEDVSRNDDPGEAAEARFEAGVRKMIGGGGMQNWRVDSSMYRGGGNSFDALRLLFQSRDDEPD